MPAVPSLGVLQRVAGPKVLEERPVRVRVATFGCRANKYDSSALGGALTARGYALAGPGDPFDVLIVNSCTVTAAADRETRRTLRHFRRLNPRATLVLTGCLAAIAGDALLPGVEADLVVANRGAHAVVDEIDTFLGRTGRSVAPGDSAPLVDPAGHSRLFIKVQDGCDVRCTFCIIPRARGRSRSIPPAEVIRTLRGVQFQGFREVIVSGINLGAYGRDLGGRPALAGLVEQILETVPVERVRLGSIEPWGVRDDLVALFAREPRLLPSIHLPLQSGCREVLRMMKRPSTPETYRRTVDRLLQARPDLAVWLDVMAGFPGETRAFFEESLSFVAGLPFTKLHVFPFSPRPGTPATGMPGKVPHEEVRERVGRFLALSQGRWQARLSSRVGSMDQVLVEEGGKGHTRDNLPARIAVPEGLDAGLRGQIVDVRLEAVDGDTLRAVPVQPVFNA